MPSEVQKFEIENVHRALVDGDRRVVSAHKQLGVLVVVASVVIFGESSGEDVEIPFLDLTLPLRPAAQVLVALSLFFSHRAFAMSVHIERIRYKLKSVILKAGWQVDLWSIRPPTVLSILDYHEDRWVGENSTASRLALWMQVIPQSILLLSPFALVVVSGLRQGFDLWWILLGAVSVPVLMLMVATFVQFFSDSPMEVGVDGPGN